PSGLCKIWRRPARRTSAEAWGTWSADHSASTNWSPRQTAVTASSADSLSAPAPRSCGGTRLGAEITAESAPAVSAASGAVRTGASRPGRSPVTGPVVVAGPPAGRARVGAESVAFVPDGIGGPLPGVDLLNAAVVLEQADRPGQGLGGGELGAHRLAGHGVAAVHMQPAAQRPVRPDVGVVLVA